MEEIGWGEMAVPLHTCAWANLYRNRVVHQHFMMYMNIILWSMLYVSAALEERAGLGIGVVQLGHFGFAAEEK